MCCWARCMTTPMARSAAAWRWSIRWRRAGGPRSRWSSSTASGRPISSGRAASSRDAAYGGAGRWQGWDWALYTPVVGLALQFDLPLLAANLSRDDAQRIVRGGLGEVFSASEQRRWASTGRCRADLVRAQTAVLDAGHCGRFPEAMLPGMLAAQAARDAVMADVLRAQAARGAVLIAGNGHVRRDLGVPRWQRGSGRDLQRGLSGRRGAGRPAPTIASCWCRRRRSRTRAGTWHRCRHAARPEPGAAPALLHRGFRIPAPHDFPRAGAHPQGSEPQDLSRTVPRPPSGAAVPWSR